MQIDKGKVALVVGAGASAGIGGAVARRAAAEGLHVFVAGRTQEKLDALVSEIEAAGGKATAIVADTTQADDVARMFDVAEKEAGLPDLVIYNAGNNRFAPLTEMSDSFFEDLWRLCAFGGFLVGREMARRVLPEGDGVRDTQATLIFTGATASMRARPPFTAFASAKAAERALAHGMAREFGKRGLHVAHAVIDGIVDGNQVRSRLPEYLDAKGEDGGLDPDAVADAYWTLHMQNQTTWTLEMDLRPAKEEF
ncbi:SDR family NAD(P)-dependent oxidoreductase [Pyruvatibacter mobilis]|uniref:SDR family NAD(P)-dependent oxidoreductase n=1 Tax=Pyruvatibacter mobilis TaxID=1712261 RepID=UPI003D14559E